MFKVEDKRFLPFSGRRFIVNQYGEVLDNNLRKLAISFIGGLPSVEIEWIFGKDNYPVGLLVLVAFGKVCLPDHLWSEIEPLYKDGNTKNNAPSNLTYRFKSGSLEVEKFPGFFYIPFHCNYAINENGTLINIETGKVKSWSKTKPCEKKNSSGGYSYSRVLTDTGLSRPLFRHRALCLVFKKYDGYVDTRVVNHLDGNPENDSLENLEWSTYSENNKHAYDSGLRPNGIKPVLMKNLRTNEIIRFDSISACAAYLGKDRGDFISYRIANDPSRVYSDMLLFKYDDDTDWPEINLDKIKICRNGHGEDFLARNVFTGEVLVFTGSEEGERITGVAAETILLHARENSVIPIKGYNFRYLYGGAGWPSHTARHLEVYKKYPIKPPDGIVEVDTETGEETFYPSRREVMDKYGLHKSTLYRLIKESIPYRKKYIFKNFKLKDSLSPSNE